MSALDLTFPNAHFDHVICAHVQTVVPDLPKAVSEIHRVRKPGGTLLVSNSFNRIRGKPAELLDSVTRRLGWFYNRNTTAAIEAGAFKKVKVLSRNFSEVVLFTRA
jgi:ubiquinone/menaquinone biosynthesis C-methylase UbiE